jgi:eukaryotic-like serine/threonine-protein kinase
MSRSALINTTIGEYRLVEKLGEGGMGEVYQGVHLKIGRVVAVKILSQGAHGPEFVERFLNEARIQGGLQHHNIVTLYDFLEFNGQPCIIMEYIEGQTLTDCVKAWGGLLLVDALRYFQSIVEAIDYVHSRGIVHRDIKSNNVKITPSGQVKLLDFGIAKSGASPALTVTGAFVGTLQYLSPEQLVGGVADFRSDIWSLGVLLYEMTTCHLPFDANTIGELCQKITKASYTPPSVMNQNVPREVQNIIARCLKKNPADRYQSARELLKDVNYAASSLSLPETRLATPAPTTVRSYGETTAPPVQLHSGSTVKVAPKPRSLVPMFVAISTLVLLIAGGGLYFLLSGDSNSGTPAKPPQQSGAQAPAAQKQPVAVRQGMFTVDVAEGRAEVYRGGELVGTTPYQFESKDGEPQVELVLKRAGYVDKPVRVSTSETKRTYTYMLEKKQ